MPRRELPERVKRRLKPRPPRPDTTAKADDLPPPEPSTDRVRDRDNPPYCKIVDKHGDLLAVVQFQAIKQQYDYCCVFHQKDDGSPATTPGGRHSGGDR